MCTSVHSLNGVSSLSLVLCLVVLHVITMQLLKDVSDPRLQRGPQELDVGLNAQVQDEVDALLQEAFHRRIQGDLGEGDTLTSL